MEGTRPNTPELTRSARGAAALAFLVLVYLSAAAFGWLPGGRGTAFAFLVVISAATAYSAWRASRRCEGSRGMRSFWMLLALAQVMYSLGSLVYMVHDLVPGPRPYPSAADALYLGFYPLMVWALVRVPTARTAHGQLPRLLLDCATIAIGGGAIIWYFVLGPTTQAVGGPLLATVVSITYPVADLVLLAGLALVLLRGVPAAERGPLAVFGLGVAMFIAADILYSHAALNGSFTTASAVNIAYALACAVFGVAAGLQRPIARDESDSALVDGSPGWSVSWLPYLGIACGFALLLYAERSQPFFPDLSLVISAILLAAVVATRQHLAQRSLVHVQRELQGANDQLAALATSDPLTGIPNHRAINTYLEGELERARRYSRPFALVFMDIDHFKALNDSFGHTTGDAALKEFTFVVSGCLRSVDIVGRWGGEEFVAIVPEMSRSDALEAAERIRATVAQHAFISVPGAHITCSIGVAHYPTDATELSPLLELADGAMYAAKHLGRNQVMAASAEAAASLGAPSERGGARGGDALIGVVEALAALVDARDQYAETRSSNVASTSVRLATALGCDPAEAHAIGLAARLHDVGKVAIADAILNKPGRLTPDEWELMRHHPGVGADVIRRIPSLRGVAPIVEGHHERWDGGGYPRNLAGERIPIGARILAVADAYSAMVSTRPYREALDHDSAMAELRRCAGTQFDPEVVDAFEALVEGERALSARVSG
jgi:diguanylate cyclase (GGDEF)-like protein